MEAGQLLGPRGLWQHQGLRGVGGWGSGKHSALEGRGKNTGQHAPVFFPGEPLPDRRLAGHRPRGCKELDTPEGTLRAQTQDFFCLWQLCPCEGGA